MDSNSSITSRCVYARPKSVRSIDQLPSNIGRSSAVHNLIESLDLLDIGLGIEPLSRARVVLTGLASREELESFHDPEYVDFVLDSKSDEDSDRCSTSSGSEEDSNDSSQSTHTSKENPSKRRRIGSPRGQSTFGLEHDCPYFPELADYVRAVAGAALQISRELREGRADIGMVWDGGRHHAQQAKASGFCYVNDIVLAIMELRRPPVDKTQTKIDRVLYLDLDVHHGDGVEMAFNSTSRVLTVSVHYHDPKGGFYPLTGSPSNSGPSPPSPASSHALNIPIFQPSQLAHVSSQFLLPIISLYKPDAVVVQCGVDGLAGDPIGGSFLGLGLKEMGDSLTDIIQHSRLIRCKVLLLGGGGYHRANAARAWAYFTSIALGRTSSLSADIPLEVESYMEYSPSFTLDIPARHSSQFLSSVKANEEFQRTCSIIKPHLDILEARYSQSELK
ncbi:hypothetical protein DFH28DRAFT_581578 [Melampsora americana]|nr:hypothetical protein DFH28DRAFT_581578 [Melampsora americana]